MVDRSQNQLMEQILNLPYEQRWELTDRLLESLHPKGDEMSHEDWNAVWIPELRRRSAEIESGEVQSVSFDEAWQRIAVSDD